MQFYIKLGYTALSEEILDFDIKKNDEEKVNINDLFSKLCIIAKNSFRALGGKSLGTY